MITNDLVDYIKNQLKNNTSRDLIISKLAKVGWRLEDIEEALLKVISPSESISSSIESLTEINSLKINSIDEKVSTDKKPEIYKVDPYRESTDLNDLEKNFTPVNLAKTKTLKVDEESKKQIKPKVMPDSVLSRPQSFEVVESSKLTESSELSKDIPKEETSKIWTPSIIKPIIEDEKPVTKPVSTRTIETFQKELTEPNKLDEIKINKIKLDLVRSLDSSAEEEIIPTLTPKPKPKPIAVVGNKEELLFSMQNEIESNLGVELGKIKPVIKKEELVIDSKKSQIDQGSQIFKDSQTKLPDSKSGLSKSAMISSYSQDYMSASKLKHEVSERKKNILIKWLLVLLVICILGGGIFVFANNYIKIPSFEIPFIKKNPKVLLLDNVEKFTFLKSYKVETEASIFLPSFINISNGLISGESVSSYERDSFSFKSKGIINKTGLIPSFFDYEIILNSSIIDGDIKTHFMYDGISSYISVPDLDKIFGESSPKMGVVSVSSGQFEQFVSLLPQSLYEKANKIDLSKVLPNESFSYLGGQNSFFFKDFTSNIEIIKKGEEEINGINTYHYSVNVDRLVIKKFLNDISNIFLINLSQNEKNSLEEIFGATSVSSFDVWIGKKDSIVYQYKFILTVPLSKVIGLEDKGIADNEVVLSWMTTYYDLDVPNNVIIPFETISTDDFMKNISDIKIKDTISSFSSLAQVMKNTLGNYGKKSNSNGNCLEPTPGSLFSPLGHLKVASNVVGDIAGTINLIINQTEKDPLCYSTSKTWAFASPLISQPDSYFCMDSKGNSVVLEEAISGTVCE